MLVEEHALVPHKNKCEVTNLLEFKTWNIDSIKSYLVLATCVVQELLCDKQEAKAFDPP